MQSWVRSVPCAIGPPLLTEGGQGGEQEGGQCGRKRRRATTVGLARVQWDTSLHHCHDTTGT